MSDCHLFPKLPPTIGCRRKSEMKVKETLSYKWMPTAPQHHAEQTLTGSREGFSDSTLHYTLLSPEEKHGLQWVILDKTEYIYFTFVILKMKGYETTLACY